MNYTVHNTGALLKTGGFVRSGSLAVKAGRAGAAGKGFRLSLGFLYSLNIIHYNIFSNKIEKDIMITMNTKCILLFRYLFYSKFFLSEKLT